MRVTSLIARSVVAAMVALGAASCGDSRSLLQIDVTGDVQFQDVTLTLLAGGSVNRTFNRATFGPTTALRVGIYVSPNLGKTVEVSAEADDGRCLLGRGSVLIENVTGGKATEPAALTVFRTTGCGPLTRDGGADTGATGDGARPDVPSGTGGGSGTGGTGAGGTGAGGTGAGGSGGRGTGGVGTGGAGSGGAGTGGAGTGGRGTGGAGSGGRGTGGTGTGGAGTGGRGTGGAGTGGAGTGGTGTGGAGTGGAGTGGAGTGGTGMPCIRSIPTPQAFDAATAGLTTKITEDFTRVQPSGDPTPPDLYSGIPGNYFFWYTEVVFDSVGASDQQYPSGSGIPYVGQRHPTVVGLGNDGAGPTISSSAGGGNYSGYDGIGARFTNGQTAVGLTTDVETAGRSFTLVVKGTDGTTLAQLAISGGNASFAGAERVCGPPIGAVDLLPNRIAGGEHGTFYWEMRSVRLAR